MVLTYYGATSVRVLLVAFFLGNGWLGFDSLIQDNLLRKEVLLTRLRLVSLSVRFGTFSDIV